jgi:hypothetical protein
MIYTFIARAGTDLPVSACCRVMRVSTSGFYAWRANPVRPKDLEDAYLSDTIVDIWTSAPMARLGSTPSSNSASTCTARVNASSA